MEAEISSEMSLKMINQHGFIFQRTVIFMLDSLGEGENGHQCMEIQPNNYSGRIKGYVEKPLV
jgi:hypothetical protein